MNAPLEFSGLGLQVDKFSYSDKKSWRGPCPSCGGRHRFVMFTDHEWPLWNGYCDLCGYQIKAWNRYPRQVDPQARARIEAQEHEAEEARATYRREKLAEFSSHELWLELAQRMGDEQIWWWENQGIPEEIQRYLSLGYLAEKKYYDDEKVLQSSPAYTIPWFGYNFTFKTLQYRLTNPTDADDRYRFEDGLGGGGTHYFMADPGVAVGDKVIICEGAKKAIVTWLWLVPEGFQVIASASCSTLGPALEATKDCGLRYVVLDPGAERWAAKAAVASPRNTRVLHLPYKVDDGYLFYGLERTTFAGLLDQARRY